MTPSSTAIVALESSHFQSSNPIPATDLFAPPEAQPDSSLPQPSHNTIMYTSTPKESIRKLTLPHPPVSAIKPISNDYSAATSTSDHPQTTKPTSSLQEDDDDDLGFGIAAKQAEERAKNMSALLPYPRPNYETVIQERDESPIEFEGDDSPIDEMGPLFVPMTHVQEEEERGTRKKNQASRRKGAVKRTTKKSQKKNSKTPPEPAVPRIMLTRSAKKVVECHDDSLASMDLEKIAPHQKNGVVDELVEPVFKRKRRRGPD